MIGAGDLRDRIVVQRRKAQGDGYGNTLGDWEDLVFRASKLTPTRGGEAVIAGRAQGVALFDCWVRFDSVTRQITTDDRVLDARDRSREFNIRFAQDMDGRKRFLLLQLELGVATG